VGREVVCAFEDVCFGWVGGAVFGLVCGGLLVMLLLKDQSHPDSSYQLPGLRKASDYHRQHVGEPILRSQ
jgi:hypothetical protein